MDFFNFFSIFSGIDFARPTWDLFILIFFAISVFLYGISLGRDRNLVILLSVYMSLAVVNTAPYIKDFSQRALDVNVGFFAFKITIFLGVFAILFFFLSRSALLHAFGPLSGGSWWQVILFSFLHVGLLMSTILSFLPEISQSQLLPITRQIFIDDLGKFLWIILPIAAMMIVPRNRE